MKEIISKGYAQGLSSHSSMQNSSVIFNQSEVFELSSISKNQNKSSSNSEQLQSVLNINCRFCGRTNEDSALIPVCKCDSKHLAHKKCVNGQAEGKCKKCGSRWLNDISAFKCSPDIIIENISSSSKLNESEGEVRMRNTIKAASVKPKCRLCGEEKETSDNKIIYPCQCHTLDYRLARAHRKCVLELVQVIQNDECENCKVRFNFEPVFKEIWVFEDNELLCKYLAEVFKNLSVFLIFAGFLGFLFGAEELYRYSEALRVWGIVLIVFIIVIGLAYGFIFVKEAVSVKRKILDSLEVLCQKQEIARMSGSSHEYFDMFLDLCFQRKTVVRSPFKLKLGLPTQGKAERVNKKTLQPRVILELDTNGENFESEMLREFSSPKISFSLQQSEDFKEEDINEHSDSN